MTGHQQTLTGERSKLQSKSGRTVPSEYLLYCPDCDDHVPRTERIEHEHDLFSPQTRRSR